MQNPVHREVSVATDRVGGVQLAVRGQPQVLAECCGVADPPEESQQLQGVGAGREEPAGGPAL